MSIGSSPVQTAKTYSGSGTSGSATFGAGVTAGNLLIARVMVGAGNITYTTPANWSSAGQAINSASGGVSTAIFFAVVTAGMAGGTSFTFSWNSSHSFGIYLEEWNATEGWPASPLDKTSTAFSSTAVTALDTGATATTVWGEELWVAALAYKAGTQTLDSITGGWTLGDNSANGSGNSQASLYEVASSTGTARVQATLHTTAEINAGAVATFRTVLARVIPSSMALSSLNTGRTVPSTMALSSQDNERVIPSTMALGMAPTLSVARHAGLPQLSIPFANYVVTVGGIPIFVLAGTVQINMAIGRRSQAQFTVHTTIAMHFQTNQAMAITDNLGNDVFTGYLANPKEYKPGFQPSLLHDIQCYDQHYLADKRIIAVAYQGQTCGFMVADIITNYLAAEGVTVGSIEAGPTIDATFSYCTAAAAFDALAARANFQWQIDAQKRFWFTSYTSIVNSTLVDGSQIEQVQTPVATVERQNPNYRNKQYVLGGTQETSTQTESRKGDGTTTAFTFSYPFATVPTVTKNGGAQTVGIKGVDSGKNWYWSKGDPVLAQDSGGTVLTTSDTLQVVYVGQFPGIFVAEDDSQIAAEAALEGTSGIVESVTTDSSVQSASDGFTLASQLLARYAQTGTLLTFWTRAAGFLPGQLITVDLPMHELNMAPMLIESVNGTDNVDSLNIWYQVVAVMGPYDTTWVQFFAALLASQQATNPINIGVSQTVGILASFTGSVTPSANLTVTAYACPLPSPTLYPSSTLYPC
jgi:hypothetical protein